VLRSLAGGWRQLALPWTFYATLLRGATMGWSGMLHQLRFPPGHGPCDPTACLPTRPPARQVRKSVRLKLLTRLEAFVDSPGQQEYLELSFIQVCKPMHADMGQNTCMLVEGRCVCAEKACGIGAGVGWDWGRKVEEMLCTRKPIPYQPAPACTHLCSGGSPLARRAWRLRFAAPPSGCNC